VTARWLQEDMTLIQRVLKLQGAGGGSKEVCIDGGSMEECVHYLSGRDLRRR
jgi:hypothetical protein